MPFQSIPMDPIGVEIQGVQLGPGLSDAELRALRRTVLAHGLVLARDQALQEQEQLALGRRFGALESLVPLAEATESVAAIANVDSRDQLLPDEHPAVMSLKVNERWHTDSSFREVPASFSIFRAVEVPSEGGDTFYASLRKGWLELPDGLRAEVEGRRAVHDYIATLRSIGSGIPYWAKDISEPVVHPMVRRHPETGELCLYISEHALEVEGLDAEAGRSLTRRLIDFCTAPGRAYRHPWRVGDVMIWDNRCMLHRAQGFDERHRRVMHHVRVAGTEPVLAPA
jgi:alpha-ketoglutarate-dependent taurine dioxygenase